MTKAQKWCLAFLTNRLPPEFVGKPVEEPSCGEIVSFVNGLSPELARKYASDYNSGERFKQKVEEAFANYRIETAKEPEKIRLPKLRKKDASGKSTSEPMDYAYVMAMSGVEYSSLVFDADGKARTGVREALAEIIASGRKRA
jgi:hypothetical protein